MQIEITILKKSYIMVYCECHHSDIYHEYDSVILNCNSAKKKKKRLLAMWMLQAESVFEKGWEKNNDVYVTG